MARRLAIWTIVLAGFAAALLFVFRTPDTDPAAMRAKYGGPPSQFIDLGGGLTVHLRDTGPRDAPAIVLLHGSNADLHTWDRWAALLDKRFRVIRYDQPGHGLTGPNPTGGYGAEAFADVADRVVTKLGLNHFTLAGNSMGGGIAWHYALAHPQKLDALVLVDASGRPFPANHSLPLGFRIAQTPIINRVMTIITPRSLVADTLRDSYADKKLATDAEIDRYWEMLRYPGNRLATIERFNARPDFATPVRLHALNMPVLILWGDTDRLIPTADAEWFHAAIPGSRVIIYPHTGHIPMEEVADKSAADVATFVNGLPQRR